MGNLVALIRQHELRVSLRQVRFEPVAVDEAEEVRELLCVISVRIDVEYVRGRSVEKCSHHIESQVHALSKNWSDVDASDKLREQIEVRNSTVSPVLARTL